MIPSGGTRTPLVLVDELAKLIADAALDLNHIVCLTDPEDRPSDIAVLMAHETARDVRDALYTMQVMVDHLRRRDSRQAADNVDAAFVTTSGTPT